MQFKYIIVTHY